MSRILPLDELNVIKGKYEGSGKAQTPITDFDLEDIIDELLDLFLLAVANGVASINSQFGTDYEPSAGQLEEVIYKKIDGATWKDRVETWYKEGGTSADIVRIAETESHRIGNEIAFEAAKAVGAKNKTWICMMLPTSREEHIWLNGVTVPIDAEFYNDKGQSTLYPGQWGVPEQDVNCLCELSYS